MRIYGSKNVLDAARDRIRFIFDEFPNVVVSVSGGKDSTVVFELGMEIAREKGRLPLKVFFLDQEAEWAATIEQIRYMMYHPDVEPLWIQVPFRLFNATSSSEHWLYCWNQADEARWMRPHDPVALTENVYGTDRFHDMFPAVSKHHFGMTRTAFLRGMRCEESPTRLFAMTGTRTYKWITWGKRLRKDREHIVFDPIYDWSYSDVWKAIHDHKWPYNTIYDAMYCHGVPISKMRVSNVHHETAVHALFYLQEIEPETYERLTQRIEGIDMAGKMGKADYFIKDLPAAFGSWREYRDYLLEHLCAVPEWRARLAREFSLQEKVRGKKNQVDLLALHGDNLFRAHIQSILTNDWEGIKLQSLYTAARLNKVRIRVREPV